MRVRLLPRNSRGYEPWGEANVRGSLVRAARFTMPAVILVMVMSLSGCAGQQATNTPAPSAGSGFTATATPTDYSNPARWLLADTTGTKNVDVFYVYPTAYSRTSTSQPAFCAVDDPQMMKGAQVSFQQQATAFAPLANVYAPYYRQVDALYQLSLPVAEQNANIQQVPLVDVTAAFEYYLQHYNKGHPFILVGHSQGSAVLKFLLSDYMKSHPDVYGRMIAAYVVGQSITPQYLAQNPHLKFGTGPADTGVILSWNTEAPVVDGTNPVIQPGGIAINPITWTTGEATATAARNLGSIQLDATTRLPVLDKTGQVAPVMNLADASIDTAKGVVICSTVDPAHYQSHFPEGVYHLQDYPFYYFDVRANAALRIQAFFASHQGN
jgi:hypothetical protein